MKHVTSAQKRRLWAGAIGLCLALVSSSTDAITVNSDGTTIKGKSETNPCYWMSDISMQDDGYIRVTFTYNEDEVFYGICKGKQEIYFAETSPKGKLRGVSGISGSKAGKTFSITVEPDTKGIYLELEGGDNNLAQRYFDITEYVEAVKRQNSDWQTVWKQSEQSLQETAQMDETPPVIALFSPDVTPEHQVFRLDTYQTFIRGRATDDAGIVTVLVNGAKAGVKANGTFAKKVKLALGTNFMKVEAEDTYGNVGERTFTIIREEFIPDTIFSDVDIPKKTRMNNPDGVAVVIGVESYQYVANATYAYNDAEVFREYLANTLGYKKSRIKIVTNSRATLAEFSKLLGPNGWISRNVIPNKSDVVVYFSGHGIPDTKTKNTGLLPFDVDPNYSIGLTLKGLYELLGSLNAKSVTVFLDTCFSGQGREKQTLLADTRGIQIVPKERDIPDDVIVLSAATAGQISGPFKEKEHGLFTYYLLKGLAGAADGDGDKKLTIAELAKYVHSKVKEYAALKGREQTPELQGDGEGVLVIW